MVSVEVNFKVEDMDSMKEIEGMKRWKLDEEVAADLPSANFCGSIDGAARSSGNYYMDPDCYDELEIVAHVERIDVEEQHRGKGYARQLLREVAKNCTKIYAAAESESAADFWKHIGGEEVEEGDWTALDVGYGVYCIRSRWIED